ncbi:MAG: hypothetical protein ACFCUQ_11530 [Kiloniellales bacterium]
MCSALFARRFGALAAGLFLAWGLALAAPGPAGAGSDRDYFQRLEREQQRRAAEERYFDDMREGWHQRARERALMRQERVPAIKRAEPPTDRLSSKLHQRTEPLGHISPRVENSADVQRRAFAPSEQRLVPRSLQEFQRSRSR